MTIFLKGCNLVLSVRKMMALFVLISIVLLGMQPPAHAEQLTNSVKDCMENPEKCGDKGLSPREETPAQQEAVKVGLTFWDFFKMILATIFTVGLLYALLKFINKKSKVYNQSQIVENLGGTALGANRSVQLIKVGNRILVVGVGENIQLLKEIDNSEEYSQIISEHNNKLELLIRPSDFLTKMMKRTANSKKSNQNNPQFGTLLSQQLEEIKKGRKKLFEELEKKGPNNDE